MRWLSPQSGLFFKTFACREPVRWLTWNGRPLNLPTAFLFVDGNA
jgi:hypothetical protein